MSVKTLMGKVSVLSAQWSVDRIMKPMCQGRVTKVYACPISRRHSPCTGKKDWYKNSTRRFLLCLSVVNQKCEEVRAMMGIDGSGL